MKFPSLQAAENYLKDTLQDFYNQRGVLTRRLRSIAELTKAAEKVGNQPALGQLIVLRSGVLALLKEQIDLEHTLEPFKNYFGVQTYQPLGVLPVALGVGAIAVATALYLHYEKLKNQEKALDLVARGILPADQAEAILNPSFFSGLGGSFASVGMLIAGGFGLYLFFSLRRS